MTKRVNDHLRKDQQVSMQEVSRLSGVSVATVSRVIHQNGRFSPDTEKRVREVMERLNYVPDAVAQGMRTRFMPIVGIIVPDIMDENYALMVRTMQTKLFAKGYSTAIYNSNEDSSLSQHFVNMLKMQHACGLVYVPDSSGGDIDPEGMPIVYFDRRPKGTMPLNSAMVESDNFTGAKNAVIHLIKAGRKNIALLSDRLHISSHQDRIQGYHEAIADAGLEPGPAYLVDPQRTSEAISVLEKAMQESASFDSIFCTSIRLTIGALTVLKRTGISENKTAVLGFGEHRLHRYGLLPYMAVHEPITEMAATAADLLVSLVIGKDELNRHVILPVGEVTMP
jgi:LacI family transcriptional regulator